MMAVSTKYGTAGDEFLTSSGGPGSGSRTRTGNTSDSYAMKNMSRSSRKKGGSGNGSMAGNSDLRSTTSAVVGGKYDGYMGPGVGHGPSVEATRRKTNGHDASSVGSTESTKMIIRKDMEYTVGYE